MNFAYLLHKELRCDGRVEHWLRNVITWHQLVEWYQWYQVNPFGEDRADLRSAMAGCAIVNEIRAISAGLGAKNLKPAQLSDLVPKFDRAESAEAKLKREEAERKREAAEYARRWKQDNDERLAQLRDGKTKPKPKPATKQVRTRKR